MTSTQISAAAKAAAAIFRKQFPDIPAKELSDDDKKNLAFRIQTKNQDDGGPGVSHLLWMCEEIPKIADSNLGKANRWLGFVQGVLWAASISTIDDLKNTNKPSEDDPDEAQPPDVDLRGMTHDQRVSLATKYGYEPEQVSAWYRTYGEDAEVKDADPLLCFLLNQPLIAQSDIAIDATQMRLEMADVMAPVEDIRQWTELQLIQANQYAICVHLHASDNDDVVVPYKPYFLKKYPGTPPV